MAGKRPLKKSSGQQRYELLTGPAGVYIDIITWTAFCRS